MFFCSQRMGERSDYQNQGGTLTRYCKGWVTLSNACTRGGYVEDYKCLIGFFGRLCGTRVDYIQTKQHTVRALKFNIRILKQGDAAPGLSTNGCPTVNLFWKLDLVPVMIHLEVGILVLFAKSIKRSFLGSCRELVYRSVLAPGRRILKQRLHVGGHLGLYCHLARCLCSRISTPQLRGRRQLLKRALIVRWRKPLPSASAPTGTCKHLSASFSRFALVT